MATDHGHDRPAPGHPAPAAPLPAVSAASVVTNAAQQVSNVHEGLQKFLKSLPFVADMAVLLLHIVGMTKLARDVAGVKSQSQAAQSGNVGTTAPASASQISDAPFGLTGISLQDEAQMKQRWDLVLTVFQKGQAAEKDFPFVFAKLCCNVLNTYDKQSRFRETVMLDKDEKKSVEGNCAMVRECQTEERLLAYLYQNGVLLQPTDSEIAWKEAKKQRSTTATDSLERELAAKTDAWNALGKWKRRWVKLGFVRL